MQAGKQVMFPDRPSMIFTPGFSMFQEGIKTRSAGLVSVVIPAYNAQRFLPMALSSACTQSYADLEIIVVDDGSTDSTREVAEAVAGVDNRVRVIHQRNAGVAAARNRGIAEARGEYVAPLDADDVWHPRNIALQVEALKTGGPEAALSYAWFVSINEYGRLLGPGRASRICARPQVFFAQMAGNFIGNGSSVVMRRSRVESVGGYDASLRRRGAEGFEDHALYLALAERWDFAVVPQYLIAYRRHAAAMSRNSRRMARSGSLVLADLRQRRPDLRGYRLGRCQAVFYREMLATTVYRREWGKLCDVFSCAAREGGGWCMFDLIGRQVPARIADHWLYRLRRNTNVARVSQPSVDVFWPMDSSRSRPLPETHTEDTRSPTTAIPLKSVT